MKKSFYTIITFARLNTKRYFRDRLAIFFTVVFPLIFLVIFGSLFHNTSNVSFKVALINQSSSPYSQQIVAQANKTKVLKIDPKVQTLSSAKEKMKRSELDATLVLPQDFGSVRNGIPNGQLTVYYNQNNQQAASTLASILQDQFNVVNTQFVKISTPFTVVTKSTNQSSLTQFDYTFSGLLGFSVLALGIFGPVNVFPELKKQGILRRLHTTPLRVWQYFTSNVLSQSVIGLFSIAIMFSVSVLVFHLHMKGSYIYLAIFAILSIFTIYGIGLAIGGWAKNERQAAPLGNLISFPLMFLSGTFFPRYLMPEWLQGMTNYLPLTPVIDGFRLIVTEGKSLFALGPQLGLMAIWAVVIYFIAFRIFRWE
ncbi:MAG TPA: ABC transporter permease [Patescibacteria group bacterium]|nr:ABC transporter permease [Patescibacteria group bacterium]